ncbi:hypothetical protein [Lysobacter firmicutimachus]|uniref:Uncharacterized protein n=1 Tax=Lysobacter firmicutimachus TaxID=1792846 RepID=A0ABU8D4T9_9GAMM
MRPLRVPWPRLAPLPTTAAMLCLPLLLLLLLLLLLVLVLVLVLVLRTAWRRFELARTP